MAGTPPTLGRGMDTVALPFVGAAKVPANTASPGTSLRLADGASGNYRYFSPFSCEVAAASIIHSSADGRITQGSATIIVRINGTDIYTVATLTSADNWSTITDVKLVSDLAIPVPAGVNAANSIFNYLEVMAYTSADLLPAAGILPTVVLYMRPKAPSRGGQ